MKPVIEAARLLRAEFTKFRTVRGWMIALCVAAVVFVLVSFLSAFESRSGNSVVPTGPGGEAVTDTYTFVHQELAGGTSVEGTPSVATAAFDHISVRGELPRGPWTEDAIAGSSPSTWQQRSAGAFTISGSGDIAPLVGGEGAATHWSGASVVNGTIVALLFVIVLAALPVTSGYRRGLIRAASAASPRRSRALVAKTVVVGSPAFAAGAIATAIAEVVTRHVFAANGNYLFPQSGPDLARVIIGTGLFLGLAAALVVAVGSMLRRSAGTVAVGIVLLLVPGILATAMGLPAGIDSWLMRLTPDAAFAIQATLPRYSLVTGAYIPANGYFPISPWAGLAVLAAYTAAALGAAVWLGRRRDA